MASLDQRLRRIEETLRIGRERPTVPAKPNPFDDPEWVAGFHRSMEESAVVNGYAEYQPGGGIRWIDEEGWYAMFTPEPGLLEALERLRR